MVFFGSSVTAGIRCKHKRERSVNFPQQLAQFLETRYPSANLTMDVYGYPGASPNFMRACHISLMQTNAADLYVLEMTDNLSDGYVGVGLSIEGLMSAVRQRAPHAALVLLAPVPQKCVRAIKRMKPFQYIPLDDASTLQILRDDCYSNNTVAASFEDVGTAHNFTTISARNLVRAELFRSPSMATEIIGRLHYDAVHPRGFGHWQLAAALEHAIVRNAPSSMRVEAHREASTLLPPSVCIPPSPGELEQGNLFAPREVSTGSMVCALGEELHQYVLQTSGWKYTTEYNKEGLPKPGYIATQPGSTLDLCHRPELKFSRASSSGHSHRLVNVAWSLGYLMSYEHMGRMRGECLSKESSCSCGARIFDAHWRLPVSQPHISRLKLQIRVCHT